MAGGEGQEKGQCPLDAVANALKKRDGPRSGRRQDVHEAGAARDHNVLDIGKRLVLGAAGQDRSILPDAELLEEVDAATSCKRSGEGQSICYFGRRRGKGVRGGRCTQVQKEQEAQTTNGQTYHPGHWSTEQKPLCRGGDFVLVKR